MGWPRVMPPQQALYRSLAACGAALVTFIGICHEAIGSVVTRPLAPAPTR